jgi:hypothetical protein
MSRPPKPPELVQWEEWITAGPPQFCHNCDHYSGTGQCFIFKMTVPVEFVNTKGQCDKWSQEVPF